MKNLLLLISGLLLLTSTLFAQKPSGYGTGEDSMQCVRNLSLYTEFYNQDNYNDAYIPWKKTLEICPASNKNIYIHGVKMLKLIIRKEKDPAIKAQYIDSLMWLYDKRIENFGKEAFVLGRKGRDLFALNNEKFEEAYEILEKSYNGRKNKSEINSLVVYMQTSVLKFKAETFTKGDIVQNFSNSLSTLEYQLGTAKNEKTKTKVEAGIANIEEIFSKSGAADCEALIGLFTTKFESDPNNIDLLKKIIMLLDRTDCTDSDLFCKTSENLYKLEPSAESAYNVAKLLLKKGEYDKATKYYTEAIDQQQDSVLKAKYYYEAATLTHAKGGQPQLARSYCYKSIAYNSKKGSPYLLIGRIYAASVKECGENDFEHKTVYWVAVDKFIKAKTVDPSVTEDANKEINSYSHYFPNTEEAFFYNINEGDKYTVKCWINETTIVRFP